MLKTEKLIAITSLAIAIIMLPRDLFAQLPPGQVFGDVPQSDTGYVATLTLFQLGISVGCDTTPDFCPDATLVRGDMAAFVVKAWSARLYNNSTAFASANQQPYFSDVPASHPQFQFVQKLYELGITGGVQAPTYANGVLTPGLYAPSGTLSNYQIAVFLSRARALADNGCSTAYFPSAKPFPVSTDPGCSPNNFPSKTSELPYFSDVCSPTVTFSNCAANPNEFYYSFIQRLGDLSVFQTPSTVIGYPGCSTCVFNENQLILRRQMAIWIVQGMGLQPESLLSMNTPGVSGGPNSYSVLPTITVQFTFTLNDQTATAGQPPPVTEYGNFFLANTNSNSFDNAPVYCKGAYAEADLKLFDGTPTNEVFAYNQPLADSGCTVSLVSVGPATGGTPGKVAVLNFTFTPAVPSGQYNVFHEVVYSVGADPWENVGTLTIQTPPQLNPAPTVTLTDTTQNSGNYVVADNYSFKVTAPASAAGLPVSKSVNGVFYGNVGNVGSDGTFTSSGTWNTADLGTNKYFWYVNGIQAGQILIQVGGRGAILSPSVDELPLAVAPLSIAFPSASGSTNNCDDISGDWTDTGDPYFTYALGSSGGTLNPGSTASFATLCGPITWDATGSLQSDGTWQITLSNGSSNPCGTHGLTTYAVVAPGCSSASVSGSTDLPPQPSSTNSAVAIPQGQTSSTTTWARTSGVPGLMMTINLITDQVTLQLTGSHKSGNLNVAINGTSPDPVNAATSIALANVSDASSTFSQTYSLKRTSLAPGLYAAVVAKWDNITLSVPVSFYVLGLTRFSQYNTPYEQNCHTNLQTAHIYIAVGATECYYYDAQLGSTFMSQVYINGTGVLGSGQVLKSYNAGASNVCALPTDSPGATNQNTFFAMDTGGKPILKITGANYRTPLSDGTGTVNPLNGNNPADRPAHVAARSVRVAGRSVLASPFMFDDQILLIDQNNLVDSRTNGLRAIEDLCPGCGSGSYGPPAWGNSVAHIDMYNGTSNSCRVSDVPDYGYRTVIRLR